MSPLPPGRGDLRSTPVPGGAAVIADVETASRSQPAAFGNRDGVAPSSLVQSVESRLVGGVDLCAACD